MNIKHPTWILALDAAYITENLQFTHGFNPVQLQYFINGLHGSFTNLASHLVLRQRDYLEKNKNYLQVLNYVVLKQSLQQPGIDRRAGCAAIRREEFFSTYYRKKGGGEDRLSDKMSIGWGGHTDADMVVWHQDGALNFLGTAINNMWIELSQECKFRFNGTATEYDTKELFGRNLKFKGFIYDPSDVVGQHHLALVWEITVPDSITIEAREDEHKLGGMCNRSELMKTKNERADMYENWSNILIDEICKDSWNGLDGANPDVGDQSAQQGDAWANAVEDKLSKLGVESLRIRNIISRTLPYGDLAKLRDYDVDELGFTPAGIFVPGAEVISVG